jgi:hypothetical protein
MPLTTKVTEMVTKPMPKVINPRAHMIADYATAGAFFVAGAMLWRKNKRAAIAAMMCGDLIGTLTALTDAPGGVWRKISFETHGKVDPGVATLTAMLPELMGFSGDRESKLFQGMGIGIMAMGQMTNYDAGSSNQDTRRSAA